MENLISKFKKLKIEYLFLAVCFFWGLITAYIVPPFQSPDEPEHFLKMWGYTDGTLNYQIKDKWVGIIVPKSIIKIYDYYSQYRWTFDKTSFSTTSKFFQLSLNQNDSAFLRYNAPVYTPLSYFPAFLFLWVLKLLNIGPLLMTYLMRICFLVLYTALGFIALKITPCKKLMFFVLETLPIMITQAAAISSDAIFFGIMFIFFAYTLKLRFDDGIEKITNKHIFKWGFLITILSIIKFAYLPLLFLYFLIPKTKFINPSNYLKIFAIIFLINTFIISLFFTSIFNTGGYRDWMYNNHNRNNFVVLKEVLLHPLEFFYMIIYTLKLGASFFISNVISSIGVIMITMPVWPTKLYWLIVWISTFYVSKKDDSMTFDIKNRLLLFGIVTILFFMVFLSVYMVYQTAPIIKGIQGRYFTPLLPLFLLLFMSAKYNLKNKYIPMLVFVISQLLLFFNLICLITRFYKI